MAVRRVALPFMGLGFVALILGIWAGLVRIGWPWPTLSATMIADHGPLMVSGFVGTLIALERAAALGHRWGYLSPLCTAAGALLLLTGIPAVLGAAIILVGSVLLAVLFAAVLSRQAQPATVVMFGGAVAWVLGNAVWALGWPIFQIVVWWVAFLVLVIAGERLELSRVRPPSRAGLVAFLVAADLLLFGAGLSSGLLLAGGSWSSVGFDAGGVAAGVGLILLAVWLVRFDLARYQIRQSGLSRFIGWALLPGHIWLGVGGAYAIAFYLGILGLAYDGMIHAIFLGFVMSMIFAHAPIIFPAVLGVPLRFHRVFYGHLILLHASLVLRLVGDVVGPPSLREFGGLLNGAALVWFLINTGIRVRLGSRPTSAGTLG